MEGKDGSCCSVSLVIITSFLFIAIVRFIYVLYQTCKPLRPKSPNAMSTLAVLGSEMINVLSALQKDYFMPRVYIAAATDNMSLQKARVFEDSLVNEPASHRVSAKFFQIYRSREVGQSYITSIGTTLLATAHALRLMIKIRPQVVVGIRWSTVFYIESMARVKRLSLSGLLLYKLHIADQFYVQWPQLQQKYPRAKYVGCLM